MDIYCLAIYRPVDGFYFQILFLYMSAFWVLFIESASIVPHLGVAKVQVSFCPWKAAAATNTCVHVDTLVQTFDSLSDLRDHEASTWFGS